MGRRRRTPQERIEVLNYARDYTALEASSRYNVDERTIRRWQGEARKAGAGVASPKSAKPGTADIMTEVDETCQTREGATALEREVAEAMRVTVVQIRKQNAMGCPDPRAVAAMTGSLKTLFEIRLTREVLDARNGGQDRKRPRVVNEKGQLFSEAGTPVSPLEQALYRKGELSSHC
jgi:hypothetical protein